MKRKILFITGTRADYGKLKSLMKQVDKSNHFELLIFVTGMHMLKKYGSTWTELKKDGFNNIYQFINQQDNTKMDIILSNTILGLSNFVNEVRPDLIVVHGDRLEALAGAIVGAFNNIKVAHIEGGEVSGTIDESIRHAISKFSHIHLVSTLEAKKRVTQLGEKEDSIFVIGSPDIDIMISNQLPTLDIVKKRYEISFDQYAILMYHPVTTELDELGENIKNIVDALIESQRNYVVIYPNNDHGSDRILKEFQRFEGNRHFRVFPSLRFEYFLTLLKNCNFMIGNSSAGVRETGIYGVPSIDIGNRQKNRYDMHLASHIIHVNELKEKILLAIQQQDILIFDKTNIYGDGQSDRKFISILEDNQIWELPVQKSFIDAKVENYV